MKITLFSIFVLLLAMFTVVPNTFAQDDATLGLPEGAKTRLGKGKINDIKYSPDGTRLAVASVIGIWIYDAQTGEELELIRGHTKSVNSVSFSPDSSTLASADEGGIVHLWDANTGSELRTLAGHTDDVDSVAFGPDGNTIATGSKDGTVLVWELNPSTMSDATEPISDTTEPTRRKEDVTGDGIVNIQDLVSVASNLGQSGSNPADINGDGIVNIQDLVLVAGALKENSPLPGDD